MRRRLLEFLRNALDFKATIVSAPTGYGKTTLLAHWRQVEEAEVPFAWVSLDEQDNDPIRLWRHIVEALRQVVPQAEGFGVDVLVGLGAVGQDFVGTTLPTLINELAELPYQVVVVLDDYQFVTEEDAHESVAFFVDHVPENVHLVISSRTDPPLHLGRMRARAQMNEIRTEQLAFSEEEAECLLNEKMGLDIGPDDLCVLLERTEGWPAGIYLASLSLQNKEDKHAFIESFRGSNRYIVGLLGEEVLAGLPEEVRQFLLETSVLRTMTGPLCDAVTGREGSAALLRELVQANLFVVSLDEQGSGTATTIYSLSCCSSSSRVAGPTWCPPCANERACGWRVLATSRRRFGWPSKPLTMSVSDCLSHAIGTDMRSPATQRPWNGG